MKKLNKTLSVLLTFVMLFTTFCFFPLDLGAIEADAAVPGIKIVVPETLYLTPSTDASTSIQYYINNNADGSVSASQDTSAKVHITYPGAKLTSVSAKTSAAISLPASITGLVGTTFGSSATTATGTFSLPAGLNAGGTALVEWTFVFDVNGKTQTHYAYSVAYAPYILPVGAAARAKAVYHNTYASSILWVTGVHGYSDGDRPNSYYAKTDTFLPMLGTITAPSNSSPEDYIQTASNGFSPTMSYQSVDGSGTKYHSRANVISPTANITVDTSRYNNFNQIPNFRVGFMVTDRENANKNTDWYVSDYGTSNNGSYYNGTAISSSQYTSDWNDGGTKLSSGSDSSTSVKHNDTWNKAISGSASFRIKSATKSMTDKVIDTTSWNNNFVNISVTGANKGTLRANVLNGTSYAKENYTADTWNTYYSALKTAATNLGNPTSATVDTSALTNAEANLHTTLTLDANGGTLGASVPNPVAMQVGGGTTSSFNNADVVAAFNATRTGYTFLGWSTDKDATTVPATVTVGFNDTVYAIWEANKYNVVFDNLFDYSAFTIGTGSLEINERTDKGFTVTSTAADGNTEFSSAIPVEPGKTYIFEADVQIEAVSGGYDMYVHTLDANQAGETTAVPDTANGAHREGNVYISLTGQTANTKSYIKFTAGDNTAYIKIRFDANAVGNKLTVNNIRVYEEGTIADGVSYEAPIAVTYDSTFGTLPTPTKTGYEFQGWVDESGAPYASSTKVAITETLRLYSTWEIGTYTITFDTDGGTAIAPISGEYKSAVTKPADPTKPGYLFTGWDKTVPDTIPPENTTITATWSENSYAVFFDGNGQTGGTANTQINTTYTGEITIPECTYEKTGYTFSYWTTNKDGTGTKYYAGDKVSKLTTVRDGGVTLYAQWAVNSYNITYVYDNGTGETKVIPFDINATVNALAAPEKTGYTFAGWKVTSAEGNWELGAVVAEGVTATGMYGNVTFTAQWDANEYTITFDTDGGSAVAPITQDFGTAITAPADPTKTGYTFDGWENLPATMPAGGATVKAKWTINQYTVTYKLDNGENDIVQTYDYNADVTAPADPTKTGYTFGGWTPALPGKMPAENVTAEAIWNVNKYTITFDADGGSAVAPITQDFGTAVTEPAAPTKTGYDFAGWVPALPETMPAENISVKATWTIKKFDVSFRFFDADGTEITVTRKDIEYGTAFDSLALPSAAEGFISIYYNGAEAAPENNTHHYNFKAWENEGTEITAEITFVAEYEAEEHNYYDDTAAKAPTCTEPGIKAEFCNVCSFRYQEEIPANGHTWEETGRTVYCTEKGTIDYKCQVCSATKQDAVDPTGHTFSGVTEKKEPTCTENGYEAYKTCTVCNKFFAENDGVMAAGSDAKTEIPAAGHNYVGKVTTVATCLEEGVMTYTCKNDSSHTYTTAIAAKGHTFTEATERVAPTCTEVGYEAYKTCEACGKYFAADAESSSTEMYDNTDKFVIEKNEHNYVAEVTPPTCTVDGFTTYTCSACGDSYEDDTVSMLGHTKGAEVIENNVDPTCVADGSFDTVTYCTVCKVQTSRVTTVVGKLGHSEGAAVEEDRTESTCTVAGSYNSVVYCITCNEKLSSVKVDLPLAAHNYVAVVTPPTCEDDGYTTHTCSACGDTYEDATTDALGHTEGEIEIENNIEPTCTTGGSYDEVVYCTVCREELSRNKVTVDPLGHDYDAVVTDPTCTTGGYTTYTCSACGDTYTGNATEELGHKNADPVIENNNPASCLVAGSYQEVVYCSVCNIELSRTDKVHVAPGHTEAVRQENIKNATCTTAGSYDNVTYCTVCSAIIGTEHVTGVTLPHTYEEEVIDDAHKKSVATCVDYAVYYYDCTECTANAKDVDGPTFEYVAGGYDENNHTTINTTLKDVVTATCYSDGYTGNMYHDCCKTIAAYGSVISKDTVAHTAGAVVVENNVLPTCYSVGSYDNVTYCSVCEAAGYSKVQTSRETITVDMVAHTAGAVVVENNVLPTCYATGSYDNVTYCSVCETAGQGKVQTSRVTVTVDMVAHTPGAVVVENNVLPTCYATGSYDNVTYCSVCAAAGKEPVETSRDTVIVPKTAHTPAEAVKENVVEATCYSEGSYNAVVYCSVAECGHKISSTPKTIEKIAHTPADAVEEDVVPATCYSEGSYNAVVYCSVAECKAKLSTTAMVIEKIAHTPGAVVVENNVAPTCYSEGSYDNVTYCTVCEAAGQGKVQTSRETVTVDMVDHTPAQAVTENVVAPKCEVNGSHDVVVYCSVCAAAGREYEISRTPVVDPMTGHVSGTYTENIDEDAGNCMTEATWIEVTYCNACDVELSRENKTGETNPAVHTGNNTVTEEDVVAGTCVSEKTWNEVTTCECGHEISSVPKTGEKDASNHTGTPTKLVGYEAPTCKVEGYTGDTLYTCCDALYASGTAIPTVDHTDGEAVVENDVPATCTENGSYNLVVRCTVCNEITSSEAKVNVAPGHTDGAAVTENNTPATCTENGSYDTVTYCTVCGEETSRVTTTVDAFGHTEGAVVYENVVPATETANGSRDEVIYCVTCGKELSRNTVVLKPVRIITFVLHGETIEIEAHTGDTLTAPAVAPYTDANGFTHQFKAWNKPLAVVSGAATYIAVYTQPCDYSELDAIKETLDEILAGGVVEDAVLEENKAEIDRVLGLIEEINKDRNTRDEAEQNIVDFVTGEIGGIIDVIYPDVGSTLVIEGSSVAYAGTVLDLKAVKMPLGAVLTDAQWVSSDDSIVFFANGKLYAIGTGTVTLTATRGILKASKTVTIIEGGNTRGINFTSINNTHFIIEDYAAVYNSAIVYWSDDFDLRFRVRVYQSFMFDDYIVYINGVEVEPDAEGYYVVPAGSGDARVTIAGAMIDTGAGEGEVVTKWSFWEWLLNLFRKIAEFFKGLVG